MCHEVVHPSTVSHAVSLLLADVVPSVGTGKLSAKAHSALLAPCHRSSRTLLCNADSTMDHRHPTATVSQKKDKVISCLTDQPLELPTVGLPWWNW